MFTILEATESDIPVIQNIAEKTWWPTYGSILTKEQLQYMLDHIYGDEPLKKVIKEKLQNFILLRDENGVQGFASYGMRAGDVHVYKLHKIYVLPENHGKGYGKHLLNHVVDQVRRAGGNTLDLNVNRFNKAKAFYEKLGFEVIAEEDVPIGPYFMNDYVMRLAL